MEVQTIRLSEAGTQVGPINPYTITSCDSLMRVCLSARTAVPVLTLEFYLFPDSDWVHLAEVTFYSIGNTCPPETIITPTTPDIIITPTPPPTTMESSTTSKHNTPETHCHILLILYR